jgi:aldehyde:ferredoxin oxidoreductase
MADFKYIKINLSSGEINTATIDNQVLLDFVGGRGFGAYYTYSELAPGIDPLGEQNKVFILAGPLAGTGALSTSRWMVCTKSPLTGAYARAVGGADFGAWLRFAGYEFIEIEGRAEKPVYIHLTPDSCRILEAGELWGLDTAKTQAWLTQEHGQNTRSACIGPAAERLVKYAGVFSERRSASRCGGGTVLGSKNLKAIAITARRNVRVADPETFAQLIKEQTRAYRKSELFRSHQDEGTTNTAETTNLLGIFPVKNFRYGRLDNYEKITGKQYRRMRSGEFACYACPARCGKAHTVSTGTYAGARSDGPEYESIWVFTGPIDSTNIAATVKADSLCDDLGLDTLSTGNSIGFAYELYERGIITRADTDGLELTYGNTDAMLELIRKIGYREGFGNILAEGVRRAAVIIGRQAEEYAIHVKGMELPAYDPRGAKSQGFNYATANIGASHCYGYAGQEIFGAPFPRRVNRFNEAENADIVIINQDGTALSETGIACGFSGGWGWMPQPFAKMLAASTGVPQFADFEYLKKVGERIINMERSFIVREGFRRKQDVLPRRILTEPLIFEGVPGGGSTVKDMQGFLDRYYAIRGWTSEGAPSAQKLAELGIKL